MADIAPAGGLSGMLMASAAPDYQTQMMQAQRRLALAQELQQQALTDTPGNGGSISWTQGLARVLDGLFAGKMANKGYQGMTSANQALAQGLRGLAGSYAPGQAPQAPQPMPQGAPPMPQGGSPVPQGGPPPMPPADPLAPLPVAPPQAAPPPPSAPPSAPMGGAPSWQPGPFSLSGTPKDAAAMMLAPEEYGKQYVDNLAKGGAPTDLEVTLSHAQQALAKGDIGTATALLQSVQKQNYIAPISGRPGGVILDPVTHMPIFQTPKIGENQAVTFDAQGHPSSVYNIPGALQSAREQAGAVAGGQASARAPFDTIQVYNPATGQMEIRPKSDVTGGGSLNSYYGRGAQDAAPSGHALPSGPSLGKEAAYNTYGKQSADAFMDTQGISKESPQRVQALREMQTLIAGPNALTTGPTASKMQQLAEEHGLPFGYSSNAFVFNKDAARFVAQSASDLGLNGSDARLGMMAHASPNMTMTPQALHVVIPTMIGLEYAKMAKATAAASWAQSRGPDTNAQFESTWRQSYDPRMFTAYAQGGPQALAQAPANVRQQWLKDYRTLKSMGVDFTQFAQ